MNQPRAVRRREFLAAFSAAAAGVLVHPPGVAAAPTDDSAHDVGVALERIVPEDGELTVAMIEAAERIAGVEYTPAQRELMLEDLQERLADLSRIRAVPLTNDVAPADVFDPTVAGDKPRRTGRSNVAWAPPEVDRPTSDDELAWMSVEQLSGLLRSRKVTSVELTEMALDRLARYDDTLQAVVTLTPERALARARAADIELDADFWRGPLHGVPWGAKDLLAVRGYPTTWGAEPYSDQHLPDDAAVVRRLDDAGAVLVAKLSLGALAWGDVWFGGRTRNPWNPEQGSSGSSAGPGSAVSAGLVPFAIGSETLGSIVSPSTRNGITGHRPSYGAVSRHGAMALSWTMDKLGPMTRSAADCALVFDAIRGRDPADPASVDSAFEWPLAIEPKRIRIGYPEAAFEDEYRGREADLSVLATMRDLGFDPVPVALPDLPADAMTMVLSAEAASAFEALTMSGDVDRLVRQERNAWPNVFRHARFISAVDYVNAQRLRTLLIREMSSLMNGIDALVAPSFRAGILAMTNLTGQPSVTMPNRFDPLDDDPGSPRRSPGSISFIGGLYRDDLMLSVAHAWQAATDFHTRRPPIR